MTDKQLIRYVRSFRYGIIGRRKSRAFCFMVCAPLETLLQLAGVPCAISSGMVENWEHFWLTLPDGRILDPTADQFTLGLPPVYLGELPPAYATRALTHPQI